MSAATEIAENDLLGLPRVIYNTLAAHPEWERVDGRVACAGADCDWVKPLGKKTIAKRWRNHQTFELQWAIGQWYDEVPE